MALRRRIQNPQYPQQPQHQQAAKPINNCNSAIHQECLVPCPPHHSNTACSCNHSVTSQGSGTSAGRSLSRRSSGTRRASKRAPGKRWCSLLIPFRSSLSSSACTKPATVTMDADDAHDILQDEDVPVVTPPLSHPDYPNRKRDSSVPPRSRTRTRRRSSYRRWFRSSVPEAQTESGDSHDLAPHSSGSGFLIFSASNSSTSSFKTAASSSHFTHSSGNNNHRRGHLSSSVTSCCTNKNVRCRNNNSSLLRGDLFLSSESCLMDPSCGTQYNPTRSGNRRAWRANQRKNHGDNCSSPLVNRGRRSRTPQEALYWAAMEGNFSAVQRYVESLDEIHFADPMHEDWTALFWAAQRGHKEMLQCLAFHPSCRVNHVSRGAQATALFVASSNSHADCVQVLLQHPDIQLTYQSPTTGLTALHAAVHAGSHEVVQNLVRHCKSGMDHTRMRNHHGQTAWDWAMLFHPQRKDLQHTLLSSPLFDENDEEEEEEEEEIMIEFVPDDESESEFSMTDFIMFQYNRERSLSKHHNGQQTHGKESSDHSDHQDLYGDGEESDIEEFWLQLFPSPPQSPTPVDEYHYATKVKSLGSFVVEEAIISETATENPTREVCPRALQDPPAGSSLQRTPQVCFDDSMQLSSAKLSTDSISKDLEKKTSSLVASPKDFVSSLVHSLPATRSAFTSPPSSLPNPSHRMTGNSATHVEKRVYKKVVYPLRASFGLKKSKPKEQGKSESSETSFLKAMACSKHDNQELVHECRDYSDDGEDREIEELWHQLFPSPPSSPTPSEECS